MYAFGAMLSFTIAHIAVTALRVRKRDEELPWRARPNLTIRGIHWPIFAIVGGLGTGAAWLVVVVQDAPTRYAGLGWLVAGFVFYPLYRRKLGEPLRTTVRAPVVIMAAQLEYRSILVPVAPGYPSDEAMDVACRLARERGARIVAMTVIHVPLELPLDAYLPDEVQEANEQLDEARAIGESYGVNVIARIVRARNSGRAIVDEATRRSAEIIVMGGPRRVRLAAGRRAIFGDTVDFVLEARADPRDGRCGKDGGVRRLALIGVMLTALVSAGSGTAGRPGFSAHVDNVWFPLRPGTVYRYRGVKDGKSSHETLTVTRRTAVIDGAPCVVVDDKLYLGGYLEERTTEWYSQDAKGNVWYFGENTAELDRRGRVTSTSGAWRAGRDGAKPGIYMVARPRVGHGAQQEFYKGQAEDHFSVVSLRVSVRVPWGHSSAALLTKEWTPLEPGVVDHKYYVRGVGTVLEQTVKGGDERNALVSVTR